MIYMMHIGVIYRDSLKNGITYEKSEVQDGCVINDTLGQTHSLASNEHYFRLKFVVWKVGTDGRTDNTCKNNDSYRPWLWVGLVDQLHFYIQKKWWRLWILIQSSTHCLLN